MAAIRCSLIFLIPSVTYAISAQWDLDPISGDWNTAANWTPNGVPNGPADNATFGLSNMTDVELSEDTEVNSIIFTPAVSGFYTITSIRTTLTISGVGIKNNSGFSPTFDQFGGTIRFTNSSTAGNAFINDGGSTNFFDRSTAGNSTIVTFDEAINFFDRSTAGSATFSPGGQGGSANFFDNSTAGSAQIFFPGFGSGAVSFFDNSTAGSAFIEINDQGTSLRFADNSTAGSATITLFDGFCSVFFEDSSQGGTARIHLDQGCILDISLHNAPGVTIGSIEGEANVFLGANNLTIGSNNLSTTFSGVIQDGGQNGGTGGSLTKIGRGTLTLTGANTYTGDTNVNRGVLQVDGSITSNTFVNRGATLAGTGTIDGNLTNNGKVSPGSAGAPGMLTVVHNYTQAQYATLMIQIAGTNTGDFSVLNVLGNANLSGQLEPVLLNGFVPTIDESFTFLNYGAVNGTLFMFNRNIDNLPEHWEVSYFPTNAILSVVAGNVLVPDQGSTFLLLTLSLFGVVTFRRQLLRGQP